MDGVLFDTERLCERSWLEVAEREGLPGMKEIFPRCIGLNANDSRQIVLGAYGEDFDYPRFREETAAWFREYLEKNALPVMDGVPEVLEWLKGRGWKVGLASSTRQSTVLSHLERAGIRDFFACVVTGDMVEHSKPLPDIYLKACAELGTKPEETYAVEDSPNGIRSAKRAGMIPLMVPDMIEPDEEMRALSHRIFRNLGEVLAYWKHMEERA
jgi:HAD superfamily hydrolase (TIGR01509 family)